MVGALEKIEKSLEVLECKIPNYFQVKLSNEILLMYLQFQGIAELQKQQKLHMRQGEIKETDTDDEVRKHLRSRLRNEYLLYDFITEQLRQNVEQCDVD